MIITITYLNFLHGSDFFSYELLMNFDDQSDYSVTSDHQQFSWPKIERHEQRYNFC